MELLFQSGNELVKLVIDRENKKLLISSSKTNYKLIPRPYSDLFDKDKEKFQETITNAFNDNAFADELILNMKKVGYVIKNRMV